MYSLRENSNVNLLICWSIVIAVDKHGSNPNVFHTASIRSMPLSPPMTTSHMGNAGSSIYGFFRTLKDFADRTDIEVLSNYPWRSFPVPARNGSETRPPLYATFYSHVLRIFLEYEKKI